MTPAWQQLEPLFHVALELGPAERAVFLTEACADSGLRSQVERLLASHDGIGAFLQSPAVVDEGVIEQVEPATEQGVGQPSVMPRLLI